MKQKLRAPRAPQCAANSRDLLGGRVGNTKDRLYNVPQALAEEFPV